MTQEELLAALGVTKNASDQDKESIVRNVLVVVEYRFADIIDMSLSDEQAKELNTVVEQGDVNHVATWIKNHMPGSAKLYDAILRDYIEELKNGLAN